MTMMPAEVPLAELSGDQLRARVARAQLYLIYSHPAGASPAPEGAITERQAYLRRLETAGVLYGFGPVDGDAYDLGIIAAASREEAERIASADPMHGAGYRQNSVRGHTMNEGVACYVGRTMAKRAQQSGSAFDADAPDGEPAASVPGLDVPLYLIELAPTDKVRSPEDTATFDAHFVWLRENEMAAKLMSCGPVQPNRELPQGVWGGGLGVVATSREEAERIAADEPSGRAGYRVLTVHDWRMQHGLAAPIAQSLVALNALPG